MSARVLYVGTFTDGDSRGIYRCRIDDETGLPGDPVLVAEEEHPSFVAVDPDRRHLYAVNEYEDGAVTAFEIGRNGDLDRIHRRVIGPARPCYCSVDATGRVVFAAHYVGGAISALPIAEGGRLEEPTVIEHTGSSVHPDRQTAPHPHSILPGPDNEYVYVPDLGTDEVVVYAFDADAATLERRTSVSVEPGAGPRHLEFGPDGRAYLINELDSTLSVYDRGSDGDLDHVDTVSTLPADFDGESTTADVHVHPSGRVVYGSNRGHDSISRIAIDGDRLRALETTSTGGRQPRGFALDPAGAYCYVGNRYTDGLATFEIEADASLVPTDHRVDLPGPSCVLVVDLQS